MSCTFFFHISDLVFNHACFVWTGHFNFHLAIVFLIYKRLVSAPPSQWKSIFFMTDLLRLNWNTIQSIHFKCTISMFRVVQPSSQCNFRAFLSPQQETLCPFGDTPLCQPQTQATTNLLSVPLNLPFLGMSCKWDNKMWVLLLRLFSLGMIFLRLICVVAYVSASVFKNTKLFLLNYLGTFVENLLTNLS